MRWHLVGIALVALFVVSTFAVDLRGASPQLEQLVASGGPITCDNGQKVLKLEYINDDYCDCDDGTDEPGTSACANRNAKFYCKNEGHLPLSIPTSWVDDGHCDCCDGSDEPQGKCQNTCAEAAREHQQHQQELIQRYEKGLSIKNTWIANYQKIKQEKQATLQQLEAKLPNVEQKYNELQEAKNRLSKELTDLKEKLTEEAKAKAAAAADNSKHDHDQEHMQIQPDPYDEELEGLEVEDEPTPEVNVEEIPEYKQKKEGGGVIKAVLEKVKSLLTFSFGWLLPKEPSEKEKADAAFEQARGLRDETKKQIDEIKQFLAIDFGKEGEFYGLYKNKLGFKTAEYVYEVESFDIVYQVSGSRKTSMGKWNSWKDAEYKVMYYKGGERCWGGPDRSTTVTLECGDENKVVDVKEPNKCEYTVKLQTPAACSESDLQKIKEGQLKL